MEMSTPVRVVGAEIYSPAVSPSKPVNAEVYAPASDLSNPPFAPSAGSGNYGYSNLSYSDGMPALTSPRTGNASNRSLASLSTQDPSMLALSHIKSSPKWSLQQRREPQGSSRKDLALPNASTYNAVYPEVTSKMRRSRGYSFSSSNTGRLELARDLTPGPGSYGSTPRVERRRTRSASPAADRSAIKTLKHSEALGFGSKRTSRPTSPRLTPRSSPDNSMLMLQEELLEAGDPLGPGYYGYGVKGTIGGGPHYSIKPRREPPKNEVPGPGSYEQATLNLAQSASSQWGTYRRPQRPNERSNRQLATLVEVPGPGEYYQRHRTSVSDGPAYSIQVRRETKDVDQVPGPG
eukprot:CAMPEP_0178442692 /NCGR_PEP_ID=MMETSP0689_2-20121128/38350_1 /TAXON_ID=160604 /ORGANISM="Amphidinium massartii, Strain CS-259" /LENGTH=348 /DNA_ID=CAMNT_0020066355 /DNA_START=59 /DNA_END=1101 /DNA_ORIENTATION=+